MVLRSLRHWFASRSPSRPVSRKTARPFLEALEDRLAPAVQTISISDAQGLEGDNTKNSPSGVVQFTVTRSGAGFDTSQPLDLDYRTVNGTGVAGVDYVGVTSGSVHFDANALTTTITVNLIGNTIWQPGPNRTFTVQVFNPVSIKVNPDATVPTNNPQNDNTIGQVPKAVKWADFNGDNKLDMVTSNDGSPDVSLLMNTSAPGAVKPTFFTYNLDTFQPLDKNGNEINADRYDVAVGDINGDGMPDIVLPDRANNSVTVMINTTPLGFAIPSFSVSRYVLGKGENPQFLTLADFNNDGRLDIATSNPGQNTVSVLLQQPNGSFTETIVAAVSNPQYISEGDFNQDGMPDLLVGENGGATTATVLINTFTTGGSSATFNPTLLHTGNNPDPVGLADFNGDGIPDVAVGNQGFPGQKPVYPNDDTVMVWLNTTPAGATTATFGNRWVTPGFVDQAYDPTTKKLFNPSGAFNSFPRAMEALDLNGDGNADITVALRDQDRVAILLNVTPPGASTPDFFQQNLLHPGNLPRAVDWGDSNGDGNLDLAVTVDNNSPAPTMAVKVFLNNTADVQFANNSATGSIIDDDTPVTFTVVGLGAFTTVVNTDFSTPVVVQVTNVHNDGISGVDITFLAPNQAISGNFGGSLTDDVATDNTGTAVSDTLTASIRAGDWTLTATINGVTLPDLTFAMTNIPADASQIDFLTQPTDRLPNQLFNSPGIQMAIEDVYGNRIINGPNSQLAITMGLQTSGAAQIDSNLTSTSSVFIRSAISGIAIFPDLAVNIPGTHFHLDAQALSVEGNTFNGLSNPFNVRGPAASFRVGIPSTLNIHQAYKLTLTALDVFGNLAAPLTGPIKITFLTHGSFSVRATGSKDGGSVRTFVLTSHTVGKSKLRVSAVVNGKRIFTDIPFYTVYGAKYHI